MANSNAGFHPRPRWTSALIACLAAAAVSGLAAILIGSRHLDFHNALSRPSMDREILTQLRIPRALLALWTGGSLALAGVLFQALLRNPLADPYALGVSGGASLGAVVAIFFGWTTVAGISAVSVSGCTGAALVLLLIVAVSYSRRGISSTRLLLAGITINSICAAVILFLSNLTNLLKSFAVTHWLMGALDAPEYSTLLWLTLVLAPFCVIILWYSREWNLLSVGETWASARGIETSRLLLIGCIAGSILTGALTALTGPIGFVGLIIPHALRLWVGADHRILAPCSFLLGASFMALCDIFARTILAPIEIPVGVITALLGGPFFIWMLNSYRGGLSG